MKKQTLLKIVCFILLGIVIFLLLFITDVPAGKIKTFEEYPDRVFNIKPDETLILDGSKNGSSIYIEIYIKQE